MLARQPVQVIDARPRDSSLGAGIAQGVPWRDPERAARNGSASSRSRSRSSCICAYGFHVGCKTAIKLRDPGFDAKYMKSGHSGWKAIGGSVKRQA